MSQRKGAKKKGAVGETVAKVAVAVAGVANRLSGGIAALSGRAVVEPSPSDVRDQAPPPGSGSQPGPSFRPLGQDPAGQHEHFQGSNGESHGGGQGAGATAPLHARLAQWGRQGLGRLRAAGQKAGAGAQGRFGARGKAAACALLVLVAAFAMSSMRASSQSAQQELSQLQSTLSSISTKVAAMEAMLQTSDTKSADHDAKLEVLQSSQLALEATQKAVSEAMAKMQGQVNTQLRALQAVQQHINTLAATINSSMAATKASAAASSTPSAASSSAGQDSGSAQPGSAEPPLDAAWVTQRLALVQDPAAMLSTLAGPLISADITAHSPAPFSLSVFMYQVMHHAFKSLSAPVVLPGARSLTQPLTLQGIPATTASFTSHLPHTAAHSSLTCPVLLKISNKAPQVVLQIRLQAPATAIRAITLVAASGSQDAATAPEEIGFSPDRFTVSVMLQGGTGSAASTKPDEGTAPIKLTPADLRQGQQLAGEAAAAGAAASATAVSKDDQQMVHEWLSARGLVATTYTVPPLSPAPPASAPQSHMTLVLALSPSAAEMQPPPAALCAPLVYVHGQR